MRGRKRNLLKIGVVVAGMLFFLALIAWVPVADAQVTPSGLVAPGTATVQVTPTVDPAITAKTAQEQLTKLQHDNDRSIQAWLWSSSVTLLSTLVVVGGGVFAVIRWLDERKKERKKRDEEHQADQQKQEKERFDTISSVIAGLGDEKEGTRVGAAIMLQAIFSRPGYEQFYAQMFDLAVAHLRIPSTLHSPEDVDAPLPLTPLRQALIAVFIKTYPLARAQNEGDFRALDASHIRLDNAYLRNTDLTHVQMRDASLIEAELRWANLSNAYLSHADLSHANLRHANLSGAWLHHADLSHAHLRDAKLSHAYLKDANFDGAQLQGADLSNANFDREPQIEGAANLSEVNLRGAKGITKEQLEACKDKGAAIDEEPTPTPTQPESAPPAPSDETQVLSPRPIKGKLRQSDQESDKTL